MNDTSDEGESLPFDEGDDLAALSAGHAAFELHYGRIEWLAYHIKVTDFQIAPMVARKLLALIEKTDPSLFFELVLARRSDLPPAHKDQQLIAHRNFDMAIEVAREGGFRRGHGKRVYPKIAEKYGLKEDYVVKCVRPFRERAEMVVEEEQCQAAYDAGEVDFLDRPISPSSGFAEDEEAP
jgi:hypothetical protein